MPRTATTRTAEMAQRPFPRSGPPSLRTSSSSDSDSLHRRSRLSDNRSPRGSQSDPTKQQKKLGTRIADLESQLGQAQDELKCLKTQLASAEPTKKKIAQQQQQKHDDKKSKKLQQSSVAVVMEKQEDSDKKQGDVDEREILPETDVFEVVPTEKVSLVVEPKSDQLHEDLNDKSNVNSKDGGGIHLLRTKLEEKGKEIEDLCQENENLKTQLAERSEEISSLQSQAEELHSKLQQASQELEKSKANAAHVNEKLAATELAKKQLENEMKSLRVQTEQWRKAADAAAYFLSGGGMEASASDGGGRRVSERCGSMDKLYYGASSFEPNGSYYGSMRLPGFIDDSDDVFGGGKKKSSSGIRMLGDLWKKKGQK